MKQMRKETVCNGFWDTAKATRQSRLNGAWSVWCADVLLLKHEHLYFYKPARVSKMFFKSLLTNYREILAIKKIIKGHIIILCLSYCGENFTYIHFISQKQPVRNGDNPHVSTGNGNPTS